MSQTNKLYSPRKFLTRFCDWHGRVVIFSLLLLFTTACGTFEVTVEDISDVGARVTINEMGSERSDAATIDEVKAEAFGNADEGVEVAAALTNTTSATLANTETPTVVSEPTKNPTKLPTKLPTAIPTTVPTIVPTVEPTVMPTVAPEDGERTTTGKIDADRESAEGSVDVVATAKRSTSEEGKSPISSATQPGIACFATDMKGLSCLTPSGEWQTFNEVNSPLSSSRISVLEACPDGSILIGASGRIHRFDGAEWTEYEYRGWVPTAFHCTEDGFWVGQNKGLAYFDGSAEGEARWIEYDTETIAPGQSHGTAKDVAVDAAGRVWVVSHSAISVLNDGEWNTYTSDADLAGLQGLETIAIDPLGAVVVNSRRAFLFLDDDDDMWRVEESPISASLSAAVIDGQGKRWMGGGDLGLTVLAESESVNYRRENSKLTSDTVQAIALDAANRAWIGTQWGLNVLDDGSWNSYHMDTSALVDHDVRLIAVAGTGPTLPALQEKARGSIKARIMLDAQPQPGVAVEACVELPEMFYSGETPCSGQQVVVRTQSDADGWFTFDDLPRGAYAITYQLGEEWVQLEDAGSLFAARIPVESDEQTYLGELLLHSTE